MMKKILLKSKMMVYKFNGERTNILFWMIVLAIMLKPESIAYLGWIKLDKTLDLLKIIVILGCILSYFFMEKKNNMVIFSIAHKLLAVIVTVLLKGDIKMALIFALNAFFFALIIYWGCDNRRIISALYYTLAIFLIVNFFTIILYPGGMYSTQAVGWEKNWFLGWKTTLPLYIIPGSALSFLFYHNTGKKRHIAIFLVAIVQPFMEGSAGAIISSLVLLFGFLIAQSDLTKIKCFFNICFIFIGYALASYLLIVVNVTEKIGRSLFSLIGKDGTLTSRTTVLWPVNLQAFFDHPFWGYGYLKQEDFLSILGGHRAHNIFLGILVSSGIVGLMIFICFILYLHKSTKRYIGTRAYTLCSSCILALLAAGLIEAFDNIGVAEIVFLMLYFLPILFDDFEGRDSNKILVK